MNDISHVEKEFINFLHEIDAYREVSMLTYWDLRTKIPKKAVEQRSEVVGFLADKIHQLETSNQMKEYIDTLKESTKDEIIYQAVLECEENYYRSSKIPKNEYKEYVMLQSKSEAVWQEARDTADFSLFQPYLEKLVEYNKRFANYWGYEENIYDALLHNYEPGVTTKILDELFPKIKHALTELLSKIENTKQIPNTSLLHVHFPKEKQKAFATKVINDFGYDFDAGRLDDTIHPFEITLNQRDVRITTRYDEYDFRMAIFGIIHEAGHALYEQNISEKLARTPLASGTSMGIHESQSLFWENIVSRSKPFWQHYFNEFREYAPNDFDDLNIDSFYNAINEVKASFIRIEADELTYPLHIMIRYELEKDLINGDIKVKELPYLWNEKMNDYLGIKPPTDREGVLQDIHWAGGDFGYFPSYALGYMYAAQFNNTLKNKMDVNELISSGNFTPIRQWLTDNIHQYGKMKKPLEIIKDVTQENLNPDYLIQYLTEKYKEIYRF